MAPHVPASVDSVGGQQSVLDRLLERTLQERREHVVLLAARLDVPLAAAGPVLVGLRICLDAFDERLLVDPGEMEHDRRSHHLFLRRVMRRRAGAMRDIGVARCIDHPGGTDRLAACLRLGDDADRSCRRP